ncbi:uncharacterized protein LOC124810847 [Hydra vulgaris]|uniref:uncharacterized protein LOC124810847 n=1 Tax=Hydra vulgaris TaxID=6087 RepID=UPI001F5F557A|nr:uncharacterized protein LOC124810847 [Hydra vulgaris]
MMTELNVDFSRMSQHVPTNKNLEAHLIEEVRRFPCLWDTTTRAYKETPLKVEAWRQISTLLNVDEKTLTSAFTKLRENFRRCLNRQKKATMSGAGGDQQPSCQFFTELLFLKDVIGVKLTSTNIKCDIFATPLSVEHRELENTDNSIKASSSRNYLTLTENETTVNSISSPQTNISTPNHMKKKMKIDPLQVALEKAILLDVEQNKVIEINNNDPDELFCKSLVSSF